MPHPKQNLRRLNSGYLQPLESRPDVLPDYIDRKAMIVYTGLFDSMDGEVEVRDEHIERLFKKHNSMLSKIQRVAGGDLPVHVYPPLQLDHSPSSAMTIGRVVGPLEMGEFLVPAVYDENECLIDTERVAKALFATVRYLGKENVQKAIDGRYAELSIGADFDNGVLQELSNTPFPAAMHARLLSKYKEEGTEKFKGFTIKVTKGEAADWYYEVDGKRYGPRQRPEDAWNEARQTVEGLITEKHLKGAKMFEKLKSFFMRTTKLSAEEADKKMAEMPEDEKAKLQADADAELAKFKKYLTETKKMSEEDADKHMTGMDDAAKMALSAEMDESAKKMAQEAQDAEKAKLTARQENITKMSALANGLKTRMEETRLASRKAHILSRLSKLKAEAKITPAEIKKTDLAKLSTESDATIEAILKTYAEREPVILTGLLSTKKAQDLSQVAKAKRLSEKEAESLSNMPFTAAAIKATRMSAVGEEGKEPPKADPAVKGPEEQMAEEQAPVALMEELTKCFALMDGGEMDKAKEMLRGMFGRYAKQLSGEEAEPNEVEMSALAESVKSMQTDITQFMQLADSLRAEK